MYGRDKIHLYINQYHSPFLDHFFSYLTVLGGGITFGLLLIVLFFKNRQQAYLYLIGYVTMSVLVQILKHWVFDDITRPLGYFSIRGIPLHIVPDVAFKTQNSFPSGHTADIFFVLCAFTLLQPIKFGTQRALFYLAVLVGFSRVYLSQHFLIDIYAGAIIGVLFSFIAVEVGKKFFKNLYPEKSL